jgi:hypothetical protein
MSTTPAMRWRAAPDDTMLGAQPWLSLLVAMALAADGALARAADGALALAAVGALALAADGALALAADGALALARVSTDIANIGKTNHDFSPNNRLRKRTTQTRMIDRQDRKSNTTNSYNRPRLQS